jgi:hypothetical protein
LATSSVRVGIACVNTSTTCAPGGTLHHAWSAIYRSIVTIDDPTPPTASGLGGSLFAGGYVRGNAAATLASATDGAGIRVLQVRVDGGRVVGETALACDYTRSRPCGDVSAPTAIPVTTSNIGDGTWTATVGAVDAGGNFTAAGAQRITVDNNAPAAPVRMSASSSITSESSTTISWAEPGGQVSPVTTAHITLCKGAVCRTTTQPAGAGRGVATLAFADGPGQYSVRVALADGAGNFDPNRAAHWTITRVAPSTAPDSPQNHDTQRPAPTSAHLSVARPTIGRDRRTITVRGTVVATARGRVTVIARARVAGRIRTVTRRATIQSGRYRVRLRLPSRRWRSATIMVRYPGNATHRSARTTRLLSAR